MSEENKPSGQSGSISTGGGAVFQGAVTVSGSAKIVGRDDYSKTGMSGEDVAKLFVSIYQQIDAKTDLKPSDKKSVKAEVNDVEAEVAKGDKADEGVLERHLHNILRMAPDILDVIASTFASPTLGVAKVISKVITKVKQEA